MEEKEFKELAKELLVYCKTYQKLQEIEILRRKKVKGQRYEEAALLIDEEKLLKLKLPSEKRIIAISKTLEL